jgi:hypothetical protein
MLANHYVLGFSTEKQGWQKSRSQRGFMVNTNQLFVKKMGRSKNRAPRLGEKGEQNGG